MIELSLWLASVGLTLIIASDVIGIRDQFRKKASGERS